jgi:hypothetical protein
VLTDFLRVLSPDPLAAVFYAVGLTTGAIMIVVWLRRAIRQRRGFRRFAAAHNLKFAGTRASDAEQPFTLFERVRTSVLLFNVVEGMWQGIPVAVFEFNVAHGTVWTAVIATTPSSAMRMRINPSAASGSDIGAKADERRGWTRISPADAVLARDVVVTAEQPETAAKAIGPRVSAVLGSGPAVSLESHFGYIYVTPRRRVEAEDLPALVEFVVSVCRGFEEDREGW